MKKIKLILAALALTLTLTGCTKKEQTALPTKDWFTNFDAAKKQAQKKDKDIFLVFSGDDWDQTSADFKAAVLGTKEFSDAFAKDNVFVNIDFSQVEYAKTDIDEKASKKQKKEAAKITAAYEVKEDLARTYALQQYPSVYILSKEGYVLANISSLSSSAAPEDFISAFEDYKEEITNNRILVSQVRASSGVEKAKAISELYETTASEYLGPLTDLVREVPVLDPQNETGTVGNMILVVSYFDAANLMRSNPAEASRVFETTAESKFLDDSQKANAWYMAAYILAAGGVNDFDRIEALLQKAYDTEPDGEHAADILNAINAAHQMKEQQAASEDTPTSSEK